MEFLPQRSESFLTTEEIQEVFLRKVALTLVFRIPVAFALGEEGKCAIRDQHRPVLKETLLSKTFASKIYNMDIVDTLLTVSFPNGSCFLMSQPLLELFLLSGRFSFTFTSTSTFRHVLSYSSFIFQLRCTFSKMPSFISSNG